MLYFYLNSPTHMQVLYEFLMPSIQRKILSQIDIPVHFIKQSFAIYNTHNYLRLYPKQSHTPYCISSAPLPYINTNYLLKINFYLSVYSVHLLHLQGLLLHDI